MQAAYNLPSTTVSTVTVAQVQFQFSYAMEYNWDISFCSAAIELWQTSHATLLFKWQEGWRNDSSMNTDTIFIL